MRISTLHAIKTICKQRPVLLRATGCRLACQLLPGIVSGCQDARRLQIQSPAKRTLMHLVTTCGWAEPSSPGPRGVDGESTSYVADFARRSLKRLAAIESEVELSDVDV